MSKKTTTTHHCDLCGKQITCGRHNGWAGYLKLGLCGNGNFRVCEEKQNRDLCHTCGVALFRYLESASREFVIETEVTVSVKEEQ